MISIEGYLAAADCTSKESADIENAHKIVEEYNRELCSKYPFLIPRNVFSDELDSDYNYDYTWLDSLEPGWRIAFGPDLCEDLKNELTKIDGLDKYRIHQIKEKFGGLRWYDVGGSEDWYNIILPKYEELSYRICGKCGRPAEYISTGWIYPYCADCAKDMISDRYPEPEKARECFKEYFVTVDEFGKYDDLDI